MDIAVKPTIIAAIARRSTDASKTPAHAQNATIGKYMRRSAARSAAGKIDELGASSNNPIRNQNLPRKGIRHTAANVAHAVISIHNGGRTSAGSIENPQGIANSRRYLHTDTPCDPKYTHGEIPDCAPDPDPGIAAARNTVRKPIAIATRIIVENARQLRGAGSK